MMKISLGWKLGSTYLLLIAIAMVALGFFILADFQAAYLANTRDNLLRYSNVIAIRSAPFLREGTNFAYLEFLARDYSEQMGNRVLILDGSRTVVADSARSWVGQQLDTPEITQAIAGRTVSQVYRFPVQGDVLYQAVPVVSGQQRLGAVFVAADLNHLAAQVNSLRERLLVFGLSTGLGIFFLSLLLARLITKPLQRLHVGVQEITAGNYGAQVTVKGRDEISALANAFNQMSEKIAAEDRVRRQFVANASHELKSPLASIKALVEAHLAGTLQPQEIKEVLTDINQEVDRLDKLVGDLLLLCRIENNKQALLLQEVAVGELVQQVVKKLNPLAGQLDIRVEITSTAELYWMLDGEMIFRALYNLLDNGIKYSPAGALVKVGYAEKNSKLSIWVEDQGIGMQAVDREKIFDRFYRLDKARSRETGGSGLGLAIVAEIAGLHGGKITVDSMPSQGSTFVLKIPSQKKKASE